ncbi:hypothetical protein P3X46_001261 [Hevea brasiliensis]|uniref:DUF4283 domain-containing protein n=1 Tax=Hevea brasiliensis TaxID=3981 RepID=A0ABQ9NBY8_HEVBR|nr:hypothetical protein P3X46_001261 [Hevea brasiliensis]
MASSFGGGKSIEDQHNSLSLEDKDVDFLDLYEIEEERIEGLKWRVIGRFLTDRSINFIAMKNTLASLWRPIKGVVIKELRINLYLFQFFHDLDIERVTNGVPWTFDQHILIMKELSMWVQAYDIPNGFMTERIGNAIGQHNGTYVESDPDNFARVWRNYMRIRFL